MDGSAGLSVLKGGGLNIANSHGTEGLDPEKLECLIDIALMEWVEAHPGKMAEYTQTPGPNVSAGGE